MKNVFQYLVLRNLYHKYQITTFFFHYIKIIFSMYIDQLILI